MDTQRSIDEAVGYALDVVWFTLPGLVDQATGAWCMSRHWDFYEAPGGGDPVRREILKARLTKAETAKLQTIMDRVAEGRTRPGDVKPLRDGVLEVRIRVGERQLRLAYGEGASNLVLLALHFFQKQRQNESRHVDIAVDRFRDWKSRHDK